MLMEDLCNNKQSEEGESNPATAGKFRSTASQPWPDSYIIRNTSTFVGRWWQLYGCYMELGATVKGQRDVPFQTIWNEMKDEAIKRRRKTAASKEKA
ncbi:hypothetical protein Y1Q_0015265 [Alligator mississippiensis]|uniref:Uncharacterized protein n=1 Tax=Alligator mississippiensis TaxID=8496 RepID=A0A151NL46_ALLMI|nr:hypothetical protein Y1Q_0015265 [Alligator mississippiensis]